MNKKTKLMYAAVLAASIAAPIAGFLGDSKGLSMTPASVHVAGAVERLADLHAATEQLLASSLDVGNDEV